MPTALDDYLVIDNVAALRAQLADIGIPEYIRLKTENTWNSKNVAIHIPRLDKVLTLTNSQQVINIDDGSDEFEDYLGFREITVPSVTSYIVPLTSEPARNASGDVITSNMLIGTGTVTIALAPLIASGKYGASGTLTVPKVDVSGKMETLTNKLVSALTLAKYTSSTASDRTITISTLMTDATKDGVTAGSTFVVPQVLTESKTAAKTDIIVTTTSPTDLTITPTEGKLLSSVVVKKVSISTNTAQSATEVDPDVNLTISGTTATISSEIAKATGYDGTQKVTTNYTMDVYDGSLETAE